MASEKDLELLDQYVSNRLTVQDKAAFEKKLESDLSLKKDHSIQQVVVEKIREARVKELKTMFNNVPATALETSGTSVATQVVLWVAVVGGLGVGLYFYLNNEDKVELNSISKLEDVTREVPVVTQSQQEIPKQGSPIVMEENTDIKSAEEKAKAVEPQSINGLPTEEEPKRPAALDVFDPSKETEGANTGKAETNASHESTLAKRSSIVVDINSSDKKFSFHYQFREGKLYLYGTFEKNLYEIMEFFSDNKRTVFLFYKNSYYLLNEESEGIKPLAPINDPTLIKKLKDYRGGR